MTNDQCAFHLDLHDSQTILERTKSYFCPGLFKVNVLLVVTVSKKLGGKKYKRKYDRKERLSKLLGANTPSRAPGWWENCSNVTSIDGPCW
jgi:hypothetical protein